MALSFNNSTKSTIEFPEFIEYLNKTIRAEDESSLLDCVEPLQMLSNNGTFFSQYINSELERYNDGFQSLNRYSAQTLMLNISPAFYVRANAWHELAISNQEKKSQEDMFYFFRAHDHNFPFLTVGYHGAGYETEMWEYDNDKVVGYPGEDVEMTFLEKTTLPKGKAMIYRASKDIHSQYAPAEFSVSINIIMNTTAAVAKQQYFFNPIKSQISGICPNSSTGNYQIFELAKHFSDQTTLDMLDSLSNHHKAPTLRVKAYDALAKITNDKKLVWSKALNDPHKIVQGHANLVLSTI